MFCGSELLLNLADDILRLALSVSNVRTLLSNIFSYGSIRCRRPSAHGTAEFRAKETTKEPTTSPLILCTLLRCAQR